MAVALVFAVAIVISGVALYFFRTVNPVHTDPAAVPSTVAATPAERYSGAVEKARSLARALLVQENLPGLSVAVAIDGEIVWAEGFGFANVERRAPVTPCTRFPTGSAEIRTAAWPLMCVLKRSRSNKRLFEFGSECLTDTAEKFAASFAWSGAELQSVIQPQYKVRCPDA